MDLDLSALKLARPETRVMTEPFPVVEIEDYLPADLYGKLLSTYPDPSKGGHNHSMKNFLKSGTDVFESFLDRNPDCGRLIRYMDSDEFLGHIYHYALPMITACRGKFGSRPWARNGKPVDGGQTSSGFAKLLDPLRFIEVETGFELSAMENGHSITPHSDAPNKLVSILVYFPLPDWQPQWGGGTQFFRPKTSDAERRWCNSDVNHVRDFGEAGLSQFAQEMEIFHTAPFSANHFTMFFKSNYTFHAVDRIACPPNRRRNCLVLNVNAKEPKSVALRKGTEWIRKTRRRIRKRSQRLSSRASA
jgi:hypothetical protein